MLGAYEVEEVIVRWHGVGPLRELDGNSRPRFPDRAIINLHFPHPRLFTKPARVTRNKLGFRCSHPGLRMPETPRSLLERLRRQPDEQAWTRLVHVYTPLLHDWLRRQNVQPSDMDDLIQDTLTVLVRELPGFQHNQRPGSFRRFLRTILVYRLRNFWRNRQARPEAIGSSDFLKRLEQLEDPHSDLSRAWDAEHDRYVVERLLELIRAEFMPSTWSAFCRTALDGVPEEAVATELSITRNAVFIAKSRVLSRLRKEIEGLVE